MGPCPISVSLFSSLPLSLGLSFKRGKGGRIDGMTSRVEAAVHTAKVRQPIDPGAPARKPAHYGPSPHTLSHRGGPQTRPC